MGPSGSPVRPRPPADDVAAAVSDLDGTLLDSHGCLSSFTAAALRTVQSAGLAFVVATARTPRAVRRIPGMDRLGLTVCANGAVIWDGAGDRVVEETCFDLPALLDAVDGLGRLCPGLGWALLTADAMYADAIYTGPRPKTWVQDLAGMHRISPSPRVVMVAVRRPGALATDFLDLIGSAFEGLGSASVAGTRTVDIVPAGITKATGAALVVESLGHLARSTVAFGDMPNDLPVLAWAGYSFAVGNAHPLVLAAADEVIAGNDLDGVARTLLQLREPSRTDRGSQRPSR